MTKKLIIAEKPSVAEDIAKVMGIKEKQDGFRENQNYIITWAIGHLLELQSPEDIDETYKVWKLKDLPIFPKKFKFKVVSRTREQYKVIKKLLKRDDVSTVINACDAGREGELIFREIIENEKVKLPIQRLWLSSMTKDAIIKAFDELKPGEELEGLANAAKSRSEADWLIGINCTRAITKRLRSRMERNVYSVGRVQTPTLSMIVAKELEILKHRPEPYWRVKGDFRLEDHDYSGLLHLTNAKDSEHKDRIFSQAEMEKLLEEISSVKSGKVTESRKRSSQNAYPLFDLTSLQREANQRFGMSAIRTLQAAQRLYEREKVLTYPRTDSRFLPEDYHGFLVSALKSLKNFEDFADHVSPIENKVHPGNKGVFDNSKVSDHFAIIPTGELPKNGLDGDDARIFDLVVRRTIARFYPAAIWENVDRVTEVKGYNFKTKGRYLCEPGWLAVFDKKTETGGLLPLKSDTSSVLGYSTEELKTKPPARIGEAKLLSLMEFAGKYLENEELYEVMEGKGIGTPATRADIIENLISKGYMVRTGSALMATSKAIKLMDVLHRIDVKRLSSVELTAEMTSQLKLMEEGQESRADFMKGIEDYVNEVIEQLRGFEYGELYKDEPPVMSCPVCNGKVHENLYGYACEHTSADADEATCTFFLRKDYSNSYLTRKGAVDLVATGESPDTTMLFPDGKTFTGKIVLKDDYSVEVLMRTDEGYESIRTKSTKELQELEQCLAEKKLDSEYLAQSGTFKKTDLAYYFEIPAFPKVLGKAPKNQTGKSFVARLPVEVCKRPMTEDEALQFFSNGKTELLTNFISKRGRPFNAKLYVKANGKYGFEFEPRAKKKPAEKSKSKKSE